MVGMEPKMYNNFRSVEKLKKAMQDLENEYEVCNELKVRAEVYGFDDKLQTLHLLRTPCHIAIYIYAQT